MELIRADHWAVVTIRAEADGEPYEGKLAVAKVIRTRMRYRYQSDGTVAGTVLHPLAFSCWNATGSPRRHHYANSQMEDPQTAEAIKAWQDSETYIGVGNAVLYHNPKTAPNPPWKEKVRFVKRIANHDFYEDPVNDGKERT